MSILLSGPGLLLLAVLAGCVGFGAGLAWWQSPSAAVRLEHRREILRLQRKHLAWTHEQTRLQLARHRDRLEASLDAEHGVDTTASELRGVI